MQAGNIHYRSGDDLPETVPVFPLQGALLLPGGQVPLNIFEPRYLTMVDEAMASNRIIGLIQPDLAEKPVDPGQELDENYRPNLSMIGCLGRITSYVESGDGRLLITLHGICRFRMVEELNVKKPYRICKIVPFLNDLSDPADVDDVDREALLAAFRAYLEANNLEADWEGIARADNAMLVNALSIMSPFGAAEKQALLEAPDLKTRAATLIAITEMVLAREQDDFDKRLQ
ncbi:LON peptidase substrate-binding domain-containing protein [Paenochrobactrum sp. BZR 588]|uniref:LON peptidase substrate-binding domain-containing protein n=1 Tax=Paenochrobactrum TaxID=999488 RepID=UPI0035BC16B8